jgi:hypothetical protein
MNKQLNKDTRAAGLQLNCVCLSVICLTKVTCAVEALMKRKRGHALLLVAVCLNIRVTPSLAVARDLQARVQ